MRGWELLIRAVAGRDVALGNSGGPLSYSDGEAIYLSEEADQAGALRGAVVQAALVAAGSLDRAVMRRLLRARSSVARRYLVLEVSRACDEMRTILPRSVAGAVERVFPGPVSRSPEESLARATTSERVPEPPDWFGAIKPVKVLRTSPSEGAAPPSAGDRVGSPPELNVPELSEDDEDASDRSRIMELLTAPSAGNPLSTALQRLLGMGRTPTGGGGGEGLPLAGYRRGPVGANAKRTPGRSRPTSVAGAPVFGTRYPEWNWAKRTYRADWCTVGEFDPPADESVDLPALAPDTRLRSALSALGLSWERHRRQDEGDLLDLTALVDYRIAAVAGGGGEPKVYEASRRTGRDLGVLVLLDATGSAAEQADGHPVFDEQRLLTWQLTAVLEELGVRVATYGFYSRGRENVRLLRVKTFDDRFDGPAHRRLFALKPGGFTRLGAAFRHGTQLLTTRAGTANLLLVVVGDGLPYDGGYEDRYAREDSRRALREAADSGVACVGITTHATTEDEAAEWIWAEATRCTVRDSRELARDVREVFGQALRRVAASHRSLERIAS